MAGQKKSFWFVNSYVKIYKQVWIQSLFEAVHRMCAQEQAHRWTPGALLPAQGDSLLPPEGPGNQHFSLSSHQHGWRLLLLVSSPGCFWNVLSKPGLAKKHLSGEPQVLAIEAYRTAGEGHTWGASGTISILCACRWEAAGRPRDSL